MGTARAFLRALHVAGTGTVPEPAALITRLNSLMCADLGDERFMTMCLCRLGADGSASYVSAGHETPLLWRNGVFEQPTGSGLILGMVEDAEFAYYPLPTLRPGDLLVLATDGIVEAQKADGVQFGAERFRATVAACAAHGPDAVVRAVVEALEAHLAGSEPHDDITLVAIARE
jgi:sigma-B regulation protein RsbU (phosphoserine phosphatase)